MEENFDAHIERLPYKMKSSSKDSDEMSIGFQTFNFPDEFLEKRLVTLPSIKKYEFLCDKFTKYKK